MPTEKPEHRAMHLFRLGNTDRHQLGVYDAQARVWIMLSPTAHVRPDQLEGLAYHDLGATPAAYERV